MYICIYCGNHYYTSLDLASCESACILKVKRRYQRRVNRVQDGLVTCYYCKEQNVTYEHVKLCRNPAYRAVRYAEILNDIRSDITELSEPDVVQQATIVLKLTWNDSRDILEVLETLQGKLVDLKVIDVDQEPEFVDLSEHDYK